MAGEHVAALKPLQTIAWFFVACVLLFRRGIIGEIANKLRIRL